jgi:DNA transformation protein and related proteins
MTGRRVHLRAMSASAGFIELLKDTMRGLGPVSVRRMFGGAGVYADGVMFALVADDTLYLKADETTRGAFEAEGLSRFGYEARSKRIDLPYWRAPERLLDDADEMTEWAATALAVARRAKAAKAKPVAKRKPGRKRSR